MGSLASLIVTADLENLRNITRVDVEPSNRASVTGKDCKVGTRNAQSRAAVVGIPGTLNQFRILPD